MGTCCVTGGTEIGDFILGKMAYIEMTDPRVTSYAAEMRDQWNTPAGVVRLTDRDRRSPKQDARSYGRDCIPPFARRFGPNDPQR